MKAKKPETAMTPAIKRQYILTVFKSFLSMASITVPISIGIMSAGNSAPINATLP